jgi:hypothetical protein
VFEFRPSQFDGIQVGGIGWQVQQFGSRRLDQLPPPAHLVGAEVVHDHHVARVQRRAQHLFHLGKKDVSLRGFLDGHGRQQAAQAQGAADGQDLPMALGSPFRHPLPAAGAGLAAPHLRGHSALIKKNQPLRRDLADGWLEGPAPLLVRFRVPFAGVE